MDPIFVVLNQIPRVLVVAGYVDDTTIVGHQADPQWIEEVFKYVRAWKTAGIVMDILADVWKHVTPIHEEGQATCSAALQLVPSYARHFVLRHGDHCIHMSSTVALESALFPAKRLCTTQAFVAGDTISALLH